MEKNNIIIDLWGVFMEEESEFNAKDVAKILSEMADFLEIKGENQYKIRAYQRAARNINTSQKNLQDLWEQNNLTEIAGVGEGLAGAIDEIFSSGTLEELEELKRELPDGIIDLLEISGLGPKRARKLFYQLEITSVEELSRALQSGEVREISGFGKKLEAKLREGINNYREYQKYYSIDEVEYIVNEMENMLNKYANLIEEFRAADGYRRRKDLVDEISFVISAEEDSQELLAEKLSEESQVENISDRKINNSFPNSIALQFKLEAKVEVFLLIVDPEIYPLALHDFTGSSDHNNELKKFCEKKGYLLSDNGLYKNEQEKLPIGEEKDIYEEVNLNYIIPELRENRGEIKAARNDELPESPVLSDLQGDLHIHSNYSDGTHSIKKMAAAARDAGYEYIAITDHSISLRIADGLTAERLLEQTEKIEELNDVFSDINILKGGEVDILSDGSLDYKNEILSSLDVVIASVHSGFGQNKSDMTSRLIAAMENPYVDIIGHPQGRLLKSREAYSVDMDRVIAAAAEKETCLEINASPSRLDLDDKMCKKAAEAGVKVAINTDAHSPKELNRIKFGVDVARRGWLEKEDIINTYNYKELCDFLN